MADTGLKRVLSKIERDRQLGKPLPGGVFGGGSSRSIKESEELVRILNIPQRDWLQVATDLVPEMSKLLKTPHGQQQLRPVQAAMLHDLWIWGGAVGIVRVGAGKTLIALLAPYVVKSLRPLLIIPANLKKKTKLDMDRYRQHWRIPAFIRVVSYEWLAGKEQSGFFHKYRPDLIVMDEGHRVKNTSAVVTRRLNDYRNDCFDYDELPDPPPFLVMSGTLTKDSIRDYWHILKWCLPITNVPLPTDFSEMIQWSMCLDARVGDLNRVKPGALLKFCTAKEKKEHASKPLKAVRQAYRRRLLNTPGIVCTQDSYEAASLHIEEQLVEPPEVVKKAFDTLRQLYQTPDGVELQDGPAITMRAFEISLGFYQRWKEPGPPQWLSRRKDWFARCRKVIKYNKRRIYSEAQLKAAIGNGLYPEHASSLVAWEEVEKSFKPSLEAVWMSDFALKFAAEWAEKHRGIVWTHHPEFGEKLSEYSGMPFYHAEGFDNKGKYIEQHPHKTPMIASIKANMIGKNLQYGWNSSLMMYTPSSGEWWEQLIGRQHREGQPEDEVYFAMFVSCVEHLRAFWKAKELDAEYVEDTSLKHKLNFADVTVTTIPDLIYSKKGSLWEQSLPTEPEPETEEEIEQEEEEEEEEEERTRE